MRCHPFSKRHALTLASQRTLCGEDAASEGKGGGIELEDGEVGELVAVGVEELVVEDAAGLAGLAGGWPRDPFVFGVEEGLRRACP